MALRKIVLQGDECLTKVCRPVTEFNQRLHTLIDDMKETLLDSGGVVWPPRRWACCAVCAW